MIFLKSTGEDAKRRIKRVGEKASEGEMWLLRGSLECELRETKQSPVIGRTSMTDQSSHLEGSNQGSGAVEGARL